MSRCELGTTLTGGDVCELTESCDFCARLSFVALLCPAGDVPLAGAILPVTILMQHFKMDSRLAHI